MDIVYHGGGAFTLKGERTVAINSDSDGAIVLHTSRRPGKRRIVNGPGEYEIAGVSIVTVQAGDDRKALGHAVTLDGITVLCLDVPRLRPSADDLTAIGSVDILIAPAGEDGALQALAADLTPRVIVPYGERAAEACAAHGARDAQTQARFSWDGIKSPPTAVLLKPQIAKKRAA